MPCGTVLAASWNDELVERLYTYEGLEMAAYDIDAVSYTHLRQLSAFGR